MLNSSVVPASQQPSRSPARAGLRIGLGLACLLALTGCAAIEVRMGSRIRLDKVPIASMQARLPQGSAIAPGEKSPLVVVLAEPNGSALMTEGKGHGKVLWKDLKVTATVATVNKKGIVSLPEDPRISDGKLPHVTITAPSHPGIQAELDVPVRYDYNYTAKFYGSSGTNGASGTDGTDGSGGMMGSIDPDNPAAGGDGSNGTNGSDGQDGGAGEDGPHVQVRVGIRPGSYALLQVDVSSESYDKLFMIDPQGGSLTVSSTGGAGGSGGKGGRGGRGGSGGMGIPNGRDGSNGSDGRSGSDGRAGSGGSITVIYDPQAKPFLYTLRLLNQGGPAPAFIEQPVGSLW
jgi:hypothetical protein